MEQIFGVIEKIVFHNPENGFTVARLKEPRKQSLTTLVGSLSGLQPGESIRCQGKWSLNPAHGMQFEVSSYESEMPTDLEGLQKYLSSGMIKGIGPKFAERIIKMFGTQTLEIIEHNPEALSSVPGIGPKKIETIVECWQSQKSIREVMIFLQKYEISPTYAQKIYKLYGEDAIETLKSNPFELAKHIPGIGFKKADLIADKMQFPKEGALRIDAGILFALSETSSEGHVCFPKNELLTKTNELLQVPLSAIEERIHFLQNDGKLAEEKLGTEESFIWSKSLYLCEKGIARELDRLKKNPSTLRQVDVNKAITWVEERLKITLAHHQAEAVKKSLTEKLHIITGGPGTGKSTITKAIISITAQLTREIVLAAPTGRAAKRMSEITRKEASTIHSLLQYDFVVGGFKRNKDNPIPCKLLIIDEASMIDTSLMYHLLKAIPHDARVIFIGDIHQLPSVGPGNVLKDLIQSNAIPVSCLTEIFRQAAGSKIITNAHKINEGIFPDLSGEKNSDFFFIKAEEPSEVLSTLVPLITERLPSCYGFDPIYDIQLLSPMKRGPIGIENLNFILQKSLNPNEPLFIRGLRFAMGDKVMQIRNNYQKEVYNGDIGRIKSINSEEQTLLVNFDNKEITYTFHEVDELVLAYACSVHKYQGSETPCAIVLIHSSHFVMLHRNLLYTAVTRGKKLVILIGSPKAIAIATSNDQVKKRYTGLNYNLLTIN